MKLIYRVISRISVALLVLLTAWATLFYFIIIDEINDETDDSLEDYSEYIIQRALAGEELPARDNGTNNSYHIREVTAAYAAASPGVVYLDQEVYIYSKKETEPARVLRSVFRDAGDRYYELTVSIPTFEKADLQETILWWVVWLYVVLLLAIIALNAWVIYRSFRPLYALLDWLDGLKLGGEIPPLDTGANVTEFRRLNDAMLRNARRNNEMYEEQRQFIGNASHEMQTPIAICRNRLEMLSDDPSLGEHQLGEILKTRETLDRISKLNRTLLLLTRIDNRQFPENSEVDIRALADRLVADYGEVYPGRHIEVDTRAPLKVTMNESLASVLVSNLIKNAFVHTPEGGSVEVAITAQGFSVSNTATEGPLDAGRIFQRFYQGSKKSGSLGLGLALVDSICRLYGMTVAYNFDGGKHRFNVVF